MITWCGKHKQLSLPCPLTYFPKCTQEFGFTDLDQIVFEDDLCLDVPKHSAMADIQIQMCHFMGGNQKWSYDNKVCCSCLHDYMVCTTHAPMHTHTHTHTHTHRLTYSSMQPRAIVWSWVMVTQRCTWTLVMDQTNRRGCGKDTIHPREQSEIGFN